MEETIFNSTLSLQPAQEDSDIYLQLYMWNDYHLFLIATFVFTRVLIDEIYHLIELPFGWLTDDAMVACLLDDLILGFSYSNLTREPTNQVWGLSKYIETKLQTTCFYLLRLSFSKNKKKFGTNLPASFFASFLKENIFLVIFYYILLTDQISFMVAFPS